MNKLLFVTIVITLALSCTNRDSSMKGKLNIFDPNGENWTNSQAPRFSNLVEDTLPLWNSFDEKNTTGSVLLRFSIDDPDMPVDTVSLTLRISTDAINFSSFNFSRIPNGAIIRNLQPNTKYHYEFIATDLLGLSDTLTGHFTTKSGVPFKKPSNFSLSQNSNIVNLTWNYDTLRPTIIQRSDSTSNNFLTIDTVTSALFFNDTLSENDNNFHYYTIASLSPNGLTFVSDTFVAFISNSSLMAPSPSSITSDGNRLIFSWQRNQSQDIIYYTVFRSKKSTGGFKLIAKVPQSKDNTVDLFYSDTVNSSDMYYYKVGAVSSLQVNSPLSYTLSGHIERPNAPNFLTASAGTFGEYIFLSWAQVDTLSRYILKRYIYSDAVSSAITLDTVSALNYIDTSVTDTNYVYIVSALGNLGPGDETFSGDAYPQRHPYALTQIGGEYSTDSTITLSWYCKNPYLKFEIERCTDSVTFLPIDTMSGLGLTPLIFTDTISKGDYTKYFYRVVSLDTTTSKRSKKSNIAISMVSPQYIDTMFGEALPDSIRIHWNRSDGADGYILYRSYSNTSAKYDYDTVGAFTDTFCTVSADTSQMGYYTVVAYNIGTESKWPNKYILAIRPLNLPILGSVYAVATAEGISLTMSSFSNVTRYIIYRSSDSLAFSVIDSVDSTYYLDPVITSDKYYYRVKGWNSKGETDFSNTVSGIRTVPAEPLSLDATKGTSDKLNEILFSWSAVTGAEKYYVYRSTVNQTLNYTKIDSVPDTSYLDIVPSDSIYYYKVRAVNVIGPGILSSSYAYGYRRPTTPPDTVASVTATKDISSYVRLTWNVPPTGSRYNGFIIYRGADSLHVTDSIATLPESETYYDDSNATLCENGGSWYCVKPYNVAGEPSATRAVNGCRP